MGATFSTIDTNKNKEQASLSDEHLADTLKISIKSMVTDYEKLTAGNSLITGKHKIFCDLTIINFFVIVT
jgi:hypothetical protein